MANTSLLIHADEGSGTTIADSGDFNASITNNNVTFSSDSKFGPSALVFNGSTTSLTISDSNVINLNPTGFCIEMFIKTSQTGQAETTVISKQNVAGGFTSGGWAFQIFDSSANPFPRVYLADYSMSSPIITSSIGGINDGAYHHLALDYDGTTYRLWVDGNLGGSQVSSSMITSLAAPITIGHDTSFGPRRYDGLMDEVRVSTVSRYTSAFTPPVAPFADTSIYGAIIEAPDTASGQFSHTVITSISGAIIEVDDTAAGSFSHNELTLNLYGSLTLPSLIASGNAFQDTDGGSITLPSLVASGYGGSDGRVTLPRLSATGLATYPYSVTGSITLPLLQAFGSATFGSGTQGSITLPRLIASGYGGSEGLVTLPSLTVSGAGYNWTGSSGSVTLPGLKVSGSIQGNSGVFISGSVTLPMLQIGRQIQGTLTLPMLKVRGEAVNVDVLEYEAYAINLKHTSDFNPSKGESATNQVTRYLGIPAKYMMRVGNNQYFLTDSKMLKEGGTTDDGNPIAWEFKTGLSDNNSMKLKHARYVYVGGRVTGGFTATVLASELPEGEFACSQPRSNLPRNTRVTAARGAKSRYFGFGLKNENGDPSMIESLQIEVDVSQRNL